MLPAALNRTSARSTPPAFFQRLRAAALPRLLAPPRPPPSPASAATMAELAGAGGPAAVAAVSGPGSAASLLLKGAGRPAMSRPPPPAACAAGSWALPGRVSSSEASGTASSADGTAAGSAVPPPPAPAMAAAPLGLGRRLARSYAACCAGASSAKQAKQTHLLSSPHPPRGPCGLMRVWQRQYTRWHSPQ